ncbi:phage tail protein [Pseudomonas leptonychotis]|uniref:phage tail protein n=1 Tax=Pseudomonas leptonychotis TaxID=2448482 RepID=UPI003862E7FF
MTDLTETTQWEPGIYQLETSDPVLAGPEGIDNLQAKQLANRTAWLKQQVESAQAGMIVHASAPDPHKQYRLRGVFTSLSANTTLTAAHEGVIVLDATAGDRTLTLPVNDAAFGVRDLLIRRADNSGNRAKVQASGADKIKFHTHLNAAGYPFLVLMGAGDWWHLRSDGVGGWWPIGRHDCDALGRPVFETTTAISPGGWGVLSGAIVNRADWPWLWDHAQASGMLTTEASRLQKEGFWTSGDGVLTMRCPDGRAAFMRVLDESKAIDPGRVAGSSQKGTAHAYDYPSGGQGAGTMAPATVQTPEIYGLDPATSAEFVNLWTVLSGGLTPVTPAAPSWMLGRSRPYNIAYPGLIKMI